MNHSIPAYVVNTNTGIIRNRGIINIAFSTNGYPKVIGSLMLNTPGATAYFEISYSGVPFLPKIRVATVSANVAPHPPIKIYASNVPATNTWFAPATFSAYRINQIGLNAPLTMFVPCNPKNQKNEINNTYNIAIPNANPVFEARPTNGATTPQYSADVNVLSPCTGTSTMSLVIAVGLSPNTLSRAPILSPESDTIDTGAVAIFVTSNPKSVSAFR